MKRYLIKMTTAFLSGALLTGCSVIPAYANSGENNKYQFYEFCYEIYAGFWEIQGGRQ